MTLIPDCCCCSCVIVQSEGLQAQFTLMYALAAAVLVGLHTREDHGSFMEFVAVFSRLARRCKLCAR